MSPKKAQRLVAAVVAAFTLFVIACGDDGTSRSDSGVNGDLTVNPDKTIADVIMPDTVSVCTLPDVIAKPKTIGKEMWTCTGTMSGKINCFFYPKVYLKDGKTCLSVCTKTKGNENDLVFACVKDKITVPTGVTADQFTCVDTVGEVFSCK